MPQIDIQLGKRPFVFSIGSLYGTCIFSKETRKQVNKC